MKGRDAVRSTGAMARRIFGGSGSIVAIVAIVALAVGLTLPSLDVGWVGDDFYHRWLLTGGGVNDPYGVAQAGGWGDVSVF